MSQENAKSEEDFLHAADKFRALGHFKDSIDRAKACEDHAIFVKSSISEQQRRLREKAERRKRRKWAYLLGGMLAAAACFLWLIFSYYPGKKYNAAQELLDQGQYLAAAEAFRVVDYRDSKAKADEATFLYAEELYNSKQYRAAIELYKTLTYRSDAERRLEEIRWMIDCAELAKAQVGDIVHFGCYEQDNHDENGTEDIDWIVMDCSGSFRLLVSKKSLDCIPYNDEDKNITWEDCTLRLWLNDYFFDRAFSAKEQTIFAERIISAPTNPKYDTDPGNATKDKIFLLSIEEAEYYFPTETSRRCKVTPYASTIYREAKGAYVDSEGYAIWGLRSPGKEQNAVSYVFFGANNNHNGTINYEGDIVSKGFIIRPAIWIDISEMKSDSQ